MTWTGPGFIDEHSHTLGHASGEALMLGDPLAFHLDVFKDGATPADRPWTDPYPAEMATEQIKQALRRSAASGLVAITDKGMDRWSLFDILLDLRAEGPLPLAVDLFALSGLADSIGPKGMSARRTGDPMIDLSGVKFYADGWLGQRTCAVRRPFADQPENLGLLFLDSTTLARRAEPYANAGFTIATHAIGDRAIAEVLDAYAKLFGDAETCREHAPRIEHAQVLAPDLATRIAEWGVVVCLQPSSGVDDSKMARAALGAIRYADAYQWAGLIAAGARVISGSDAPMAASEPLVGLQHLVTGCAIGSREPLAPTLDVVDALDLMTDSSQGTVTLSADPTEVELHEIATIEVLGTSLRL